MRNIPTKRDDVDGLPAAEWNEIPDELENLIESSGQTLSGADIQQVAKSIVNYMSTGDYYIDTGSTNNFILSSIGSQKRPTAYSAGMRVRFIPQNTNTGGTTINVNSIGSKVVLSQSGDALNVDDIRAGRIYNLTYSALHDAFLITVQNQATVNQRGTIKLASDSDLDIPVTNNTKAVTPKQVGDYVFQIYPIGFVYLSYVATNPATLLGFGTWTQIQGRFLAGVGTNVADGFGYTRTITAKASTGTFRHQLTLVEYPPHSHQITSAPILHNSGLRPSGGRNVFNNTTRTTTSAGSTGFHNNIPPYIGVYVWERTA